MTIIKDNLEEMLSKFGLSRMESKVYITLLKLKEASVIQIAKVTQVHRRSIYDNLNLLIRKGLVNFKIKGKTKYYEAQNPKNLKILVEEKNKILDEIMPDLNTFYSSDEKKPKIKIYSGENAGMSLLEEVIKEKGEKYWIGGGTIFFDRMAYSRKFIEEKVKEMDYKAVQPKYFLNKITKYTKSKNVRILPKEFKSNQGIMLFGNKVGIGIIQETDITIIVIESKESFEAFKKYFNVLWNLGKKITQKDIKESQKEL